MTSYYYTVMVNDSEALMLERAMDLLEAQIKAERGAASDFFLKDIRRVRERLYADASLRSGSNFVTKPLDELLEGERPATSDCGAPMWREE